MGLHSAHLELGVGARWSARAFALTTVLGYVGEYFFSLTRPYLVLFIRAIYFWAGGSGWWVGSPPVARMVHITAALPPLVAALVLLAGWALYFRLRRRRALAADESRRGADVVGADALRRRVGERE